MKKIFKTYLKILFILFLGINSIFSQQEILLEIIKEGDEWQYYDKKEAPPIGWENQSNLTNNWEIGKTPLGYGDSVVATTISFGNDSLKKDITKYFKKTFSLNDPFQFILYKLNIQKDDGIIVYLNGREIARYDMPDGEIGHETEASSLVISGRMESKVFTKILSPDDFIDGLNTLSVSVHQATLTSEDCIFNLELVGDNHHDMIPLLLKEQTIKNLKLDIKIKGLKHKLELEKRDLELNFSKKSKSNLKIAVYVICLFLFIFLAILIRGWYYYKKKEFNLSKEILGFKNLLNQRDQEMMSNSLISLNNHQYLKELKLEIERSAQADSTLIKKSLAKIINKLDYQLDQDDEWGNLKKHFNAVHTGFFDKLLNTFQTLTEIEVRHCVFIKLHMQTKEIARILHINPRSVQASRYRIKKKMNLDENVDLREFLLNF